MIKRLIVNVALVDLKHLMQLAKKKNISVSLHFPGLTTAPLGWLVQVWVHCLEDPQLKHALHQGPSLPSFAAPLPCPQPFSGSPPNNLHFHHHL